MDHFNVSGVLLLYIIILHSLKLSHFIEPLHWKQPLYSWNAPDAICFYASLQPQETRGCICNQVQTSLRLLYYSQKWKCSHFGEVFVVGCTVVCHFDSLWCSHWWWVHQVWLSEVKLSEWVIKFNGHFETADIWVHIVHTSHVIMTYTLESLSSLT